MFGVSSSQGGSIGYRAALATVVALGAFLAEAPPALAVDHVVLDLDATKVAAPPPAKATRQERARLQTLSSWRLVGRVVGRDFHQPGDAEILGVTLRRRLAGGTANESHGLRAAPARTLTFDGEAGRWVARLGDALTINMAIAATGPPRPVEAPLCSGAFQAVPVTLKGRFELATRTKLFRTIRLRAIRGVVYFSSPSMEVDCGRRPPAACDPETVLTAVHTQPSSDFAALLMSPSGRWTTLSFAEHRSGGVTWYHVMELVGVDPLAGQLPTLTATLGAPLPVRGSGSFTASQTSRESVGACSVASATGTFAGSFRASFAGWGLRRVTFGSSDFARYSDYR